MLHQNISIEAEGSAPYARLTTYLWDRSEEIPIEKRPLVLILPGGAYAFTSDREGEAVALSFMTAGFHAAVLRYSTAPAVFPTALEETAVAVRLIRENAQTWHVDADKIFILGFSAGGHLAASYGVYWNDPLVAEAAGASPEGLKIAGLLLGYPVITANSASWHEESIRNLLGDHFGDAAWRNRVSLEKHVGCQTPPCFIWNTFEDGTVPPENSLFWVQAMMKNHIPVEYHLYAKGRHGLSLASPLTDSRRHDSVEKECQNWPEMAAAWIRSF